MTVIRVHVCLLAGVVPHEADGLASDVDVLVVLEDGMDWETADALRSIAYDVMLEYGPVVELHVLSETEFEHAQIRGIPFIENVIHEGRAYA